MADYVRRVSNIEYDDTRTEYNGINLYLPVNTTTFPLLIFIPDMVFAPGCKEDYDALGREIAGAGIACAVMDVRPFGDTPYHRVVEDGADSVAYLLKGLSTLGHVTGVFLGGHGSGAAVAMHLSFDRDRLMSRGVDPTHLAGYLFAGGLCSTHRVLLEDKGIAPGVFTCDIDAPMFHLPTAGPPILIMAGGKDEEGVEEESALLAYLLRRKGYDGKVIYHAFPRFNHRGYLVKEAGSRSPFTSLIVSFIGGM